MTAEFETRQPEDENPDLQYENLEEVIYGYLDSGLVPTELKDKVGGFVELHTRVAYARICIQRGWPIPEQCTFDAIQKELVIVVDQIPPESSALV